MNFKILALSASLLLAGFVAPGSAGEGVSHSVPTLVGLTRQGHHHGHWDVWYYGWNGQYWGWRVYGSYHAEFEALQARNYLWSIGHRSAYYVYHY